MHICGYDVMYHLFCAFTITHCLRYYVFLLLIGVYVYDVVYVVRYMVPYALIYFH